MGAEGEKLAELGLLELTRETVRLTREGRFVADAVVGRLL